MKFLVSVFPWSTYLSSSRSWGSVHELFLPLVGINLMALRQSFVLLWWFNGDFLQNENGMILCSSFKGWIFNIVLWLSSVDGLFMNIYFKSCCGIFDVYDWNDYNIIERFWIEMFQNCSQLTINKNYFITKLRKSVSFF